MSKQNRDVWCDHCDYRFSTQIRGEDGVGTCPNCGKPTLLVTCGVCENASELSFINFERGNWICPQCKEYREFSAETLTDFLTAQIAIEPAERVSRFRRPSFRVGCGTLVLLYVFANILLSSCGDLFSFETSYQLALSTPTPVAVLVRDQVRLLPPTERNNYYDTPFEMNLNTDLHYEAIFYTEKGRMRFRLYDDAAPVTVNNFINLAQEGFYNDTTFHRVLEDFMAQGGDPTGAGTGGPGYWFEDEVDNDMTFDRRGLLAMANSGPNTNGSQFFITFEPTPHLNGSHTIFGELIAGDDVLSAIDLRDPSSASEPGDVIETIVIEVLGE